MGEGRPGGLAHLGLGNRHALADATVYRNGGQFLGAAGTTSIDEHLAVRREARGLIERTIGEDVHAPGLEVQHGDPITAAAVHHGLTLPHGAGVGIKGGWLAAPPLHTYPSEMAQNFWTAIWAWSVCFVATIAISLLTRQLKTDEELKGLVYALTPRPKETHLPWWQTAEGLGVIVLVLVTALNVVFW